MSAFRRLSRMAWLLGAVVLLGISVPACTQETIPTFPELEDDNEDDDDGTQDEGA